MLEYNISLKVNLYENTKIKERYFPINSKLSNLSMTKHSTDINLMDFLTGKREEIKLKCDCCDWVSKGKNQEETENKLMMHNLFTHFDKK